jgi:hypothetical protein
MSYYRVISTEAGRKLAEKWKAVFVEASAKQNEVSYAILLLVINNFNSVVRDERSVKFQLYVQFDRQMLYNGFPLILSIERS